jgi:hypothetical protein
VDRVYGVLLAWLLGVAALIGSGVADATVGWQVRGYVAHAMGSPRSGTPYTNSREAFEASYAKGFRAFEVDLVRTKDAHVLVAHDDTEHRYGLPKGVRFRDLTAPQLRGLKYDGKYRVLFGEDLIGLMRRYPDITVVLDLKGRWQVRTALARRLARYAPPDVLSRMYPHVHSQVQLDAMRGLKAFPNFVLALYKWPDADVAMAPGFMERNGLDTVLIKTHLLTDDLRLKLVGAGARFIFVHPVRKEAHIMAWRKKGVGVYSDGWIGL